MRARPKLKMRDSVQELADQNAHQSNKSPATRRAFVLAGCPSLSRYAGTARDSAFPLPQSCH